MQIRTPLAATAIALGMTFGGAALAQEAPAPEAAPAAPAEAPAAAANYTPEQLDAFVAAALEVSGIQQEAAAELMTTEDQAGQDEVLQQANDRMVEAIEAQEGITVPEYIEIAETAETDPELRDQLEEMIIAAQGVGDAEVPVQQ